MGFRAFNATDKPSPNAMAAAAMMMDRTPIMSLFLPALSWNLEKGTH
jgi:hypothetical protein